MKIKLSQLRIDGGTQPRAEVNPFKVDEYVEDMNNGAEFPPVTVFYDGKTHWLADGYHRIAARRKCGYKDIECDVQQGTQRDAILYSVGANATHGLRRTNDDKRRAVNRLLSDDEWEQWSNREIARRCKVSEGLVRSLRTKRSDTTTYTTKHGTPATMDTSNIGKTQIVYDKAPEPVKHQVEAGLVTINQAYEITEILDGLPLSHIPTAGALVNGDTEKARKLMSLYQSSGSPTTNGTYEEIIRTGGFHYGEDMENHCDYADATISDITRGLASIARYHAIIEKQNQEVDEMRINTKQIGTGNKLIATQGANELTITINAGMVAITQRGKLELPLTELEALIKAYRS